MDITLERILSLIPKKPDGSYVHGAKKEFAEKCKNDFPKVAEALKVLNYVNRIRRNLYRHMKERAA